MIFLRCLKSEVVTCVCSLPGVSDFVHFEISHKVRFSTRLCISCQYRELVLFILHSSQKEPQLVINMPRGVQLRFFVMSVFHLKTLTFKHYNN